MYSVVTIINGDIRYWSDGANAHTFLAEHNGDGEFDAVLEQLILGCRICTDRPYDTFTLAKANAALAVGFLAS
jgi:hypothetical protein